jgi:hypothetical protein
VDTKSSTCKETADMATYRPLSYCLKTNYTTQCYINREKRGVTMSRLVTRTKMNENTTLTRNKATAGGNATTDTHAHWLPNKRNHTECIPHVEHKVAAVTHIHTLTHTQKTDTQADHT